MEAAEDQWSGGFDPSADSEETRVLFAALDSFHRYRSYHHRTLTHPRRQAFYALPSAHQALLHPSSPLPSSATQARHAVSYLATLDNIDSAIDANAELADRILQNGLVGGLLTPSEDDGMDDGQSWRNHATASDLEKARVTLRQFYRDWSAEGDAERQASYGPVLLDLEKEFPPLSRSTGDGGTGENVVRNKTKVLIPGAGLGRLVYEVCMRGFEVQGNEISYHALIASSFILNSTAAGEQFVLHPWIHTFSNHLSRDNQLRHVMIPDVHPGTSLDAASRLQGDGGVHAFERMSMSAADFITEYSSLESKDVYDAIVTVFFIDTAPNALRYIETVLNCLKSGGVWINLGPLLWHWAAAGQKGHHGQTRSSSASPSPRKEDGTKQVKQRTVDTDEDRGIGEPGSVELTNEEVLYLVSQMGFVVESSEVRDGPSQEAGYIDDAKSMMGSRYRVAHWVARKT